MARTPSAPPFDTIRPGYERITAGVDPATLAGDQLGVLQHRVPDPCQGSAQRRIRHGGRIGQACEREGETTKRHAEGDDPAAIGRGGHLLERNV